MIKGVFRLISALLFLFLSYTSNAQDEQQVFVLWPDNVLEGVENKMVIEHDAALNIEVFVGEEKQVLKGRADRKEVFFDIREKSQIEVRADGQTIESKNITPIPLWLSIIPPLLAILLALVFREVVVSLFLGIFVGCLIPGLYAQGITGFFTAFLRIIDTYIIDALNDKGHLSVIVFSMIIGATVSLISKNGGMSGVVNRISVYAKSRRSGQMATWFLGIAIFFDDYANTLIVGNTMRPVTDRLKISREKLAYIVDSTAAPIAAIAFITTWIGAELGYIQDGINVISGINATVYSIFLNSLQFSFYPIFTLIFIAMLVWMKRDFGPMYTAEKRAVTEDPSDLLVVNVSDQEMKDFEPDEKTPKRSYNAIIPVSTIIVVTIAGLLSTGYEESAWSDQSIGFFRKLSHTIGMADPYKALLWSSLTGLMVAAVLTLSQKILSIQDTIGSIIKGFKTMLTAMIILILAWSLSAITEDLHTADFLTGSISGILSPYALPLSTFILAGFVSFATGSSWGTMAILYPMILPLSWSISTAAGLHEVESLHIFYNVTSCVLAGSVLGDHCSPISDTTILSSLASSCNHIDHVRTQLPYALSVGIVALLIGTLPASFGFPFYGSLLVGIVLMYLIIRRFGKVVDN